MVNRWSADRVSLGAVATRHYEGMESLAAFAPPPAPHIRRTTNDNGPCVTRLNAGASTTSVGGSSQETATAFPHTTQICDIPSDRPPEPGSSSNGRLKSGTRSRPPRFSSFVISLSL